MIYFLSIDTFNIQSVTITNTTDGRVCLECIFSSFSTDTKCTVVLVSSTDSTVQYNETFTRLSTVYTANGCISNVTTGQYDITVYSGDSEIVSMRLSLVIMSTENIIQYIPVTVDNTIIHTALEYSSTCSPSIISG